MIQECTLPQTFQELSRFLGLVNSYRRLLANAADTQRPLNAFLKCAKKKDKRPVPWTEEAKTAFQKCKDDVANLALFAFPSEMQICASKQTPQTPKWEQPSSSAQATCGNLYDSFRSSLHLRKRNTPPTTGSSQPFMRQFVTSTTTWKAQNSRSTRTTNR